MADYGTEWKEFTSTSKKGKPDRYRVRTIEGKTEVQKLVMQFWVKTKLPEGFDKR